MENNSKFKFLSFMYFILFMAGAMFLSFLLYKNNIEIEEMLRGSTTQTITIILMLMVSLEVSTIFHQIGHLVFGLLTGYSFISIRYRNLLLKRNEEGTLGFHKYSLTRSGGHCLMRPPKDKKPGLLYNAGGALFNITAVSAVYIILLIFAPITNKSFVHFLTAFAFVNLIMSYSIWSPLKRGYNDGTYYRLIKKNPVSKEAQLQVLELNARLTNGELLTEIDMDIEDYKTYDPDDILQRNVIFYYIMRSMYDLDFHKSLEIIEYVEQNTINKMVTDYSIIIVHLMVLYYIDKERAGDYYFANKKSIDVAKQLMKRYDQTLILNLLEEYIHTNTINQEILSKYYERVEKSVVPGDSIASTNLVDEILRRSELTKETAQYGLAEETTKL